jgi:hypothetical protein
MDLFTLSLEVRGVVHSFTGIKIVRNGNIEHWYQGKSICKFLQLEETRIIIRNYIPQLYKTTLKELQLKYPMIRSDVKFPNSWFPNTIFISPAGVSRLTCLCTTLEATLLFGVLYELSISMKIVEPNHIILDALQIAGECLN